MMSLVLLLVGLARIVCGQNKWEFYSWSSQPGAVAYGRLDPIITPGAVSPHVHMFHGSGALQATYDYDTIMRESTCSTVQVQQDFSNYWAPAMYYYDGKGSYELMLAVFQVYYKFNTFSYDANNASGSSQRYAFPPGLTMLAGNMFSRQVNNSDPSTYAAVFQCQRSSGDSPYSHDFRDFQKQGQQCDNSLRVTVDFPSCWDGVADNSDGTHMVYPNSHLGAGGVCPASHPKATMQLTYEWYYPVQNFPFDASRDDNWVLSFGDTSGYGMHSDFTNGWNVTLLQEAVDQCADSYSTEIENCAPFAPWNGHQVPPCMASGLYPNEEVGLNKVTLDALPGCNPLWTDNSTKPTCAPAVPVPPIDLRYGPDLSSWNYVGCPMSATPAGLILWDVQNTGWTNMTVDICLETCSGYRYAMLTWGDNCYCDNQIKNNGSLETSMEYTCFEHCAGDWSQICGGFGSASFYEACTGDDCFQNREIGPLATAALGAGLPTSTTSVPKATPTAITCAWSDGRNYTEGGQTFEIECWQNHLGGDLTRKTTSDMEQCLAYCAEVQNCVAVVWTPSDGMCYSKNSTMGRANTDGGCITGLLGSDPPASSSIAATSIATIHAASSASTATTAAIILSAATSKTTTAIASAATPSTSAAASTCPALDGQTVVNDGKNYTIGCDIDHVGGDATSLPGSAIDDCLTACSTYKGCLGVSYNIGQGLCWIKTTIPPTSSVSGVIAGILEDGRSTSASTSVSAKSRRHFKTASRHEHVHAHKHHTRG